MLMNFIVSATFAYNAIVVLITLVSKPCTRFRYNLEETNQKFSTL